MKKGWYGESRRHSEAARKRGQRGSSERLKNWRDRMNENDKTKHTFTLELGARGDLPRNNILSPLFPTGQLNGKLAYKAERK